MKCDKIKDMIASSYIDGECAVQERSLIEAHLKVCASCRDFHAAVMQTKDVLNHAPSLVPDESVWANIEAGILPQPAWWENFLILPRPAFAFAAAMFSAFFGSAIAARHAASACSLEC